MVYRVGVLGLCVLLGGCGQIGFLKPATSPSGQTANGELRPQSRPDAIQTSVRRPPPSARTAEEFDTTTTAERQAAAAAPVETGERLLGRTVASLGDPARPGFWVETPLVSAAAQGRVVFPGTGESAQVDLIPIDGPATAGSRISLAAMRLIGAPLTGLPEIEVYSGG